MRVGVPVGGARSVGEIAAEEATAPRQGASSWVPCFEEISISTPCSYLHSQRAQELNTHDRKAQELKNFNTLSPKTRSKFAKRDDP